MQAPLQVSIERGVINIEKLPQNINGAVDIAVDFYRLTVFIFYATPEEPPFDAPT